MKKTYVELLRLFLIAIVAFIALGILTNIAHYFLPSTIAQILVTPLFILWFLLVAAFAGFGPFSKLKNRLNKAAIEDSELEKEKLAAKQPWEI